MQQQPFAPHYGSGVALAAGVASSAYALDPQAKNVAIVNTGAAPFFVRIAKGTAPGAGVTAVLNADFCVPNTGHPIALTKADGQDTIAVIAAGAGGTGFAICGEGYAF